jgi:hypothetical protein
LILRLSQNICTFWILLITFEVWPFVLFKKFVKCRNNYDIFNIYICVCDKTCHSTINNIFTIFLNTTNGLTWNAEVKTVQIFWDGWSNYLLTGKKIWLWSQLMCKVLRNGGGRQVLSCQIISSSEHACVQDSWAS